MNTLTKPLFLTMSLVLASFSLPTVNAANDQSAPTKARPLARLYPYGERAQDVMGLNVRGSAGESLGTLKDLVIDARTGRIVYGIVSTGGVLGIGDTQRAVPFSALSYAEGRGYLRIDLALADWQRAPVYQSEQFSSLADRERAGEIFRAYHQNWEPLIDDPTLPPSAPSSRLQLASSLIGREVRAGDQKIGEAEDLIVNVGSRRAQLLLRPNPAFAGSTEHFVVPFSKVTAPTTDSDRFATTLTRSDFASTQTFDENAWNERTTGSIYRWKITDPASPHAAE